MLSYFGITNRSATKTEIPLWVRRWARYFSCALIKRWITTICLQQRRWSTGKLIVGSIKKISLSRCDFIIIVIMRASPQYWCCWAKFFRQSYARVNVFGEISCIVCRWFVMFKFISLQKVLFFFSKKIWHKSLRFFS